ncbi:MAG: rod-binding protein [Phycisphaerae bacterium]|nr:rod-binding protein [Phycisphaerae bacterium]MDW8262509.1 rod-binding protein [Phycisphaerales bacterium]
MTIEPSSGHNQPTPAQLLRHRTLRKQAEKFVAQTFFTPIFKAMRSSPFKSRLLSGGRGGEAFQAMLDGLLAERMGRGAAKPLVDAIVNRLDPHTARLLRKTRVSAGPVPTLVSAPLLSAKVEP